MSRRRSSVKRSINPDSKFKDFVVEKFINCLMLKGKKSLAEKIFYEALLLASENSNKSELDTFREALKNVKPLVEVRSRRVGGATYQVPVEVRSDRAQALAIRWTIIAARKRSEQTMKDRLAAEILDASYNRGTAVKKKEESHRMAEANKAFSHYRW